MPEDTISQNHSTQVNAGIWKSVALVLIGMCGTGVVSWGTYVRTAITRDEMEREIPALIARYSPYTTDASDIKDQLQDLKAQNTVLETQVQKLQVDVARISEKIGVAK